MSLCLGYQKTCGQRQTPSEVRAAQKLPDILKDIDISLKVHVLVSSAVVLFGPVGSDNST